MHFAAATCLHVMGVDRMVVCVACLGVTAFTGVQASTSSSTIPPPGGERAPLLTTRARAPHTNLRRELRVRLESSLRRDVA